ncbi:AcrR family transcriptional regulator [Actinoplanes lutulentus]|uniref:TetR family transcriptional regulator n=1 Tax=Actinoplanes lutulentus TaxID=1287878 RepID=A0A327ZAN4_9ACTN|nr:TetR/AcrR family transcriptional regulator [Actinoplanes lutulentus]MBB2940336.1 AcrR family transcriptional regulator [Actinoplanes lutulentus]RAK28829.1 TetR family transcriptional regulator [Actinoplanes lutulentus]
MTTEAVPAVSGPQRRGQRRDAAENRDRILLAARNLLVTNPNASMDDVAHAAGVVRRTVYAHFPNRDELLTGLGDRAATDMLDALRRTDRSALDPAVAMADFSLTIWTAGDQYRLLISLAESEFGSARLRDLLAPIREQGLELLIRGRDEGRFATHLPLPVLSAALQAVTLSLLQAVNDELWTDDGDRAARAVLIAAGVPATEADGVIQQARAL